MTKRDNYCTYPANLLRDRIKENIKFIGEKEDSSILILCIEEYIKCMEEENKIPIIDIIDLCEHLSIRKQDLFLLSSYENSKNYRNFSIPKSSGGCRQISVPSKKLYTCQKWIKQNILDNVLTHECAHGYVRKKSIITNARKHINSEQIVRIDIENFFPSIKNFMVEEIFLDIGYPNNVSRALSNLCVMNGTLPQGAPTSPIISNIVFMDIDEKINEFCQKKSIIYSRYADDIFISGKNIDLEYIKKIKSFVENGIFKVNDKKTKKMFDNNKLVTGLRIENGKIFIKKSKKNKIKNLIFYVRKIRESGSLDLCHDPYIFERCLAGLQFWLSVEPDNEFVKEKILYVSSTMKIFSPEKIL